MAYYRPQQSWGKVIFSGVFVKNSVHRGEEYLGMYPSGRYSPQAGTPPGQVHPTQADALLQEGTAP